MPSHTRVSFVTFAAAAAFASACGGKDSEAARQVELQPPASSGVALGGDTAVSNTKAGAATTAPGKAPTKTTTAAPKPASGGAAAAPVVKFGLISSGTQIAFHSANKVCTNTQKAGDRVEARTIDAVTGSDGATIPAGSVASLEVVESQYGQNDADKVKLTLRVASFTVGAETYDVTGADILAPAITKVRRQSTGDQIGKVAVGTAAGAVVGRVIGKDTKSTVIGGAVGAATGAVVAKKTADYDGCIAADARLVATLTRDVRVRVGA